MIPVAILGAGPAGLAVAHALRTRGVAAQVFEAGPAPLHALRHLDPALHLVSPRALSGLPGLRWPRAPGYLTFGALVEGLTAWAKDLPITCDFKVMQVDACAGGYRLHTATGVVEARVVVCCTGVLAQPSLPAGIGPSPTPWWHARDVRPADIQGRRDLLVVGGGVSAGEVLALWLKTAEPGDRARLALRSPLKMLPHHVLGLDTHYLAWLPEHLPARVGRWRFGLRHEPLLEVTAQRAIRAGRVEKVSGFAALGPDGVRLMDGSTCTPDAVVFATGYTHTTPVDALLSFDADGWPILRRSQARPGLFVVGMRFGHTLASPFLRGISRDARAVARRVARHLNRPEEVSP